MRTPLRGLLVLVGVLTLIPPGEAAAQRRRGLVDVSPDHERHGFWLSLGVGAGWENFRLSNVEGCNGQIGDDFRCDDLAKPSFNLGLGGTVNSHLRLGAEINGWVNEYNDFDTGADVTETLIGVLLVGQVYPLRQLGAFVKGGLGISRSAVSTEGDNVGETGFSTLLGIGYEIRLGRSVFLTPMATVMQHRSDPGNNDPDGVLRERVATLGVNVTFQPGR
jgi:hypothetical protein